MTYLDEMPEDSEMMFWKIQMNDAIPINHSDFYSN